MNIIDRSRACKEIIIGLAVFFLPLLFSPHRPTGGEFNDPRRLLGAMVFGLGQMGLVLFLILRGSGRDPAVFGLGRISFRGTATGFLAFLPMLPLAFLVLYAAARAFPGEPPAGADTVRWTYTNYSTLPLTAAVCLVTGYREELFFRSFLPAGFGALGAGPGAAALGANLLFALGHLYQGGKAFLVAFFLGIYLAELFRRKGDLHANALAHGLYNLAALLAGGLFGGAP